LCRLFAHVVDDGKKRRKIIRKEKQDGHEAKETKRENIEKRHKLRGKEYWKVEVKKGKPRGEK